MIRFLQKDNRFVKAIFIVIIGAAVLTMVITLIPGIFQDAAVTADTYATVYPYWYSRFAFTGEKISMARVQQAAQTAAQRQGSRVPPQFMEQYIQMILPQAAQQLILQKVMLAEASHLNITANEEDVKGFIKTQLGQYFFPNGVYVGDDKYKQIVYQLTGGLTPDQFQSEIHDDIVLQRLRRYITAGVTVSDSEIRDQYRKANIKIKFDYAVIATDDLRKQIKPSDDELHSYFVHNAQRYANAVPEERKISYFSFNADQIPGGVPQATPQEIQDYYNAHKSEYEVPEQARSRHILIKFPGGAAKTDAEAKAKADDLLKQLKAGANFADLAKKNSDDTGSGAQGGELGPARHGMMVPEFDSAIFSQKIGDLSIVKTQYGYHIIQVEDRQAAHTQPINEVQDAIKVALIRDKESKAELNYAQNLAAEAAKNGLDKAAAAHHLQVVTTQPLGQQGVIAGLPDGTQVLQKAFAAKKGAAPDFAPTGEGYAVFQVADITAAHLPKFEDFKSTVLKDYADEKLPQLLAQKTKELADKAKASGDLAKAAKEVGASVKTSDLVGEASQVPDFGQIGSVARQLFELSVGGISGPINAQRTGVVAKLLQKQEPTADEITKNLDQTRDAVVEQKREEAFNVFVSTTQDRYKKAKLIAINTKVAGPPSPIGGQ